MGVALPRAGRNSSKHHHIWPACETICFPVFHSFLITIELPHAFPFSATGTRYRLAVWVDSVLMQEVPVSKLPLLFPDTLKESNTHGQQSDFIRVPASPRKPGLAGKGNPGLETRDSPEALVLPPAFYGLVSSSELRQLRFKWKDKDEWFSRYSEYRSSKRLGHDLERFVHYRGDHICPRNTNGMTQFGW